MTARLVPMAELDRYQRMAEWVDRHGYTAENALDVFARRMREEAADVARRVEAGELGRSLLNAAAAFRESAARAEAASAALGSITEAAMQEALDLDPE